MNSGHGKLSVDGAILQHMLKIFEQEKQVKNI